MEYSNEAIELLEAVLEQVSLQESERWQYRYKEIIENKKNKLKSELKDLNQEISKIEKEKKNPDADVDEKELNKKYLKQITLISKINDLPSTVSDSDSPLSLDQMKKGTQNPTLQKIYKSKLTGSNEGKQGKSYISPFIMDGKSYTPLEKVNKTGVKKSDMQIDRNMKNPGAFADSSKKNKKTIKKDIKKINRDYEKLNTTFLERLKSKFKNNAFVDKLKNLFKGKTKHEAVMIMTEALDMILTEF